MSRERGDYRGGRDRYRNDDRGGRDRRRSSSRDRRDDRHGEMTSSLLVRNVKFILTIYIFFIIFLLIIL